MSELSSRIEELARTPVLLVASDFDGTLSPIASEPSQARPKRESIAALHALAVMPNTFAAVISGRALGDLAERSGLSSDVFLVGSHGSEFDAGFATALNNEARQLHARIKDELALIASDGDGLLIEVKPASVALHYRNAEPDAADRAVNAVMHGPAMLPGVQVKPGKRVLELSVVPTDKGRALSDIRHRVGATATIFIGDDESDEDAFALLRGPDIGVKVGPGTSIAEFCVDDTDHAARLLATLVEHREQWLKGMEAVPIERHAMLSDQRTVALLTDAARLVWCCLPRIDSSAIFAELLGGPSAGYFAIRSADGVQPLEQRYDGDSFILETRWPHFRVVDFMDCSGGRAFQRAGRSDLVRSIEGSGQVEIEFAPRLDFGRQPTRLEVIRDGLRVGGSPDPISLRAPDVQWTIHDDGPHQRATATVTLTQAPLLLELRYGMPSAVGLAVPFDQRLEQSRRFWNAWAGALRLPGRHTDLVRRSALTIKALCHGPTGAIVAAGTTGLPEHLGGIRNWDYRFCWLRDSALAATTLARLGSTGVGMRLLDWLLELLEHEETAERFRPVYTVTGEHLGVEAEIRELAGYCASRPVRVSNAAAQQLQLDVFGPIVELMHVLASSGVALSTEHWRLITAVVNAVGNRWMEPDHGIWEVRQQQRHFVHSKVMCWVAVDRAISVAEWYIDDRPAQWLALRETIAADVLGNGWNESLRTFTSSFGDTCVDAACLHVGLSGLLPAGDPRFRDTVDVVERSLRRGPTVFRYLYDDGLPGREGGFHLCTSWLIEALAMIGEQQRAIELLDQFVATFGSTGLAPEEYCPRSKRSLGNHPQAYTHLGLINAVLALETASASSGADVSRS